MWPMVEICGEEENIRFDNDEGQEECVPWTLQMYIKLSNITYVSRATLYCVKKLITEGKSAAVSV